MLRPFEMNLEMIQMMAQKSQQGVKFELFIKFFIRTMSSEECFLNFNPDDQDIYHVVVENWTQVHFFEKISLVNRE